MQTLRLENDIQVFYIAATSFPGGVLEAHQKLHALIPFSMERKYFGISRPENGVIIYKAAAEEMAAGEAEQLHSGTLILKRGNYIAGVIHDFMKDIPAIGRTFKELLTYPGIDPDGYCIEWYLDDKNVRCMVRLEQ
jgi:hypothetical protein